MDARTRRGSRTPVWSPMHTHPIAMRIPERSRRTALRWIKAIHTAAFFSIAGAIAILCWDGLRGRSGRRPAVAATLAVAESVAFGSNNLVCPLTPLAAELGAEQASVTDLYLPGWLSERVPLIGGSALIAGVGLQALARRH